MTNEQTLKLWTKKCLKKGLMPIGLICCDNDGFPHVFSQYDTDLLKKIYEHLATTHIVDESTSFDGQEN